jgi:predicted neuraminidase
MNGKLVSGWKGCSKFMRKLGGLILVLLLTPVYTFAADTSHPAVVCAELLFPPITDRPYECHSPSIAQVFGLLTAVWYAGRAEGTVDTSIWLSHAGAGAWSRPMMIADGDGRACWNPVLYSIREADLILFYKVGTNPRRWQGMSKTSFDAGKTWSDVHVLPDGIIGPVKNKPLFNIGGELVCPSSTEGWGRRVHVEFLRDGVWERMPAVPRSDKFKAIQPALLVHPEGKLQMLCRTKRGLIAQSWSMNGGRTWSPMYATTLVSPDSGIDAVTLDDGRHLLVYNHSVKRRTPLTVAISSDGIEWNNVIDLETDPGEYSYPSVIQTSDGQVHIVYTWKRRSIKHVVLDPNKL